MARTYRIGALAAACEVPVETIRYYEHEGLLLSPRRSQGNYRLYDEAHRERLVFIRQCRALDMTLDEIRQLLKLKQQSKLPCDEVNTLLDAHLGHVNARIAEPMQLKGDLQALRRSCQVPQATERCPILVGLSSGEAAPRRKPEREPTVMHRRPVG